MPHSIKILVRYIQIWIVRKYRPLFLLKSSFYTWLWCVKGCPKKLLSSPNNTLSTIVTRAINGPSQHPRPLGFYENKVAAGRGRKGQQSFVFHPHQPPSENRKLENTYKLTLLKTVLSNVFSIQLYCSICLFASRDAHVVDKCTRRSLPRSTRRGEMAEGKKPKEPREHSLGAALKKKNR